MLLVLSALVLLLAVWAVTLAPGTLAQDIDDAGALNAKVVRLYKTGKYADAIPLAERVLAIREAALPPDHADIVTSLNNLAALYLAQNRYADAVPLYTRALAINEKARGPSRRHQRAEAAKRLKPFGPGVGGVGE